jgi:hypothetical protein
MCELVRKIGAVGLTGPITLVYGVPELLASTAPLPRDEPATPCSTAVTPRVTPAIPNGLT